MTDIPSSNPITDVLADSKSVSREVAARRPRALTAVCIIAVVLGILGLLSSVSIGVSVLFGAQMQRMFGGFGAASDEQAQAQQEMYAATATEMERFAVVNTALSVAQLALCGGLVYSGLKTLGLHATGRQLLLAFCISMLVFEIGRAVVSMIQQLSLSPILELYLPRILKESLGGDAGTEQFGRIFARITIVFQTVTQCIWTLIKCVFFAAAIRYLRKAQMTTLFNPSATQPPLKPETT